jgi:hypothetical protein
MHTLQTAPPVGYFANGQAIRNDGTLFARNVSGMIHACLMSS